MTFQALSYSHSASLEQVQQGEGVGLAASLSAEFSFLGSAALPLLGHWWPGLTMLPGVAVPVGMGWPSGHAEQLYQRPWHSLMAFQPEMSVPGTGYRLRPGKY